MVDFSADLQPNGTSNLWRLFEPLTQAHATSRRKHNFYALYIPSSFSRYEYITPTQQSAKHQIRKRLSKYKVMLKDTDPRGV